MKDGFYFEEQTRFMRERSTGQTCFTAGGQTSVHEKTNSLMRRINPL